MGDERRWFAGTAGAITLVATIVVAVSASRCGSNSSSTSSIPSIPSPATVPQCDAGLWAHVYTPARLTVMTTCETMTGVVASQHTSEDGDIDMRVTPDPQFSSLLNAANEGTLQVEAICQGAITSTAPEVSAACKGFIARVPIPAVGARVRVTGSYVLDTNHHWMEIHPATSITLVP